MGVFIFTLLSIPLIIWIFGDKKPKCKHTIHANGNVRITSENGHTRIDISE